MSSRTTARFAARAAATAKAAQDVQQLRERAIHHDALLVAPTLQGFHGCGRANGLAVADVQDHNASYWSRRTVFATIDRWTRTFPKTATSRVRARGRSRFTATAWQTSCLIATAGSWARTCGMATVR